LLFPLVGAGLLWLMAQAVDGRGVCDGVQALLAFVFVWAVVSAFGGGWLARANPDAAYRNYVVVVNAVLALPALGVAWLSVFVSAGCTE